WSHDIGGHMLGDKDNERLVRWIQFGVFSPIMRIHSNNSIFVNKEPWALPEPYHGLIADLFRLRHRLIPYLYTEIRRSNVEDVPLIRPMYYDHAKRIASYEVPNEYYFGNSLIVCSITTPQDKALQMAPVSAFVPEGKWYDIFTGHIYEGNGVRRKLYRPLDKIPVLLNEGSIVPLSLEDRKNGTDNPASMRILVGAGKSGEYTLYEDDGISMDYAKGEQVLTRFGVDFTEGTCEFTVDPAKGDTSLIPAKRSYEIWFYGVQACPEMTVKGADTCKCVYDGRKHILKLYFKNIDVNEGLKIKVSGISLAENDKKEEVIELLDRAWIEMETKDRVFWALIENEDSGDRAFLNRLSQLDIPENLKDAIEELY
ncbi:MAG: DUF5110 domain-containing protein, partial [Lachnospiraceae bacterium]|nr:DUF5110 domain-containing protein [Lachnospiraceae bacterium]